LVRSTSSEIKETPCLTVSVSTAVISWRAMPCRRRDSATQRFRSSSRRGKSRAVERRPRPAAIGIRSAVPTTAATRLLRMSSQAKAKGDVEPSERAQWRRTLLCTKLYTTSYCTYKNPRRFLSRSRKNVQKKRIKTS
jgi:hypothetical protein